MINIHGFRIGVGIILCNASRQVLLARRIGQPNVWQFPQGGLQFNEDPKVALYRELHEELGLKITDVKLLSATHHWFSYLLPVHLRRTYMRPLCIGQKQKWFLLQLVGQDTLIHFDATEAPEFDEWRWVDYWHPLKQVVQFKRPIYRAILEELQHALPLQDESTE